MGSKTGPEPLCHAAGERVTIPSMPVTTELRDPKSPISRFLRAHFPHTGEMARDFRGALAHAETIRPVAPLGAHGSTIGTAFDWRLRFYLSPHPSGTGCWPGPDHDHIGFYRSLAATIDRLNPVGRRLEQEAEDLINRYCLVLALRDQLAWSGSDPSRESPFLLSSPRKTVEAHLAIVQDTWLDDLRALSWGAYEVLENVSLHPAVLKPTFAGADTVGGAEADLIAAGCLIEIKTTTQPRWNRSWLDQLLSYVLLDYFDEHRIRSIALYLARQKTLLRWSIEEWLPFLMGLTDSRSLTIEALRAEFRGFIEKEYL
jgi:hypothetical protein